MKHLIMDDGKNSWGVQFVLGDREQFSPFPPFPYPKRIVSHFRSCFLFPTPFSATLMISIQCNEAQHMNVEWLNKTCSTSTPNPVPKVNIKFGITPAQSQDGFRRLQWQRPLRNLLRFHSNRTCPVQVVDSKPGCCCVTWYSEHDRRLT